MGKLLKLILFACVTSVLGREQTGKADSNSKCAKWCASNFPKTKADCTKLAARGKGPCYECGPLKPYASSKQLCSGACVDTKTDNKNCGKCGKTCRAGTICSSRACHKGCGIFGCLDSSNPFYFEEVDNVSLKECLSKCSKTASVSGGGPCVTVQYVPADKLCNLLDAALPGIRYPESPPDICGGYFFYDVHCHV